jgi:hypothetical protein
MLKKRMTKRGEQSPWVLISLILALAVAVFFIYNFVQYNQLFPASNIQTIADFCVKQYSEQNQFVSSGLPAFTIEQAGKKIIYSKGFTCYYLSKLDSNNPAYDAVREKKDLNDVWRDWDSKIKIMDVNKNETFRKQECENNKNLMYVYSAKEEKNKYTLEVTICNAGIAPTSTKNNPPVTSETNNPLYPGGHDTE